MISRPEQWQGRAQIALAALLWSTSGFFAKAPWFDAWPEEYRGLLLGFWRSLFAAIVLIFFVRRPTWQWQMLPMAGCFTIMVWSFMTAMVHGSAANAIWLQYLCPAWVLIVGVGFLREKVGANDIRMFLFCLSGVSLILVCEFSHTPLNDSSERFLAIGFFPGVSERIYATLLGLLSGLSFAGVVMLIRSLRNADSVWLITINHAATASLLLPWVLTEHRSIAVTGYCALGFFGVFQMSIAYILFARGLRSTSSGEASVLSLIEPILVPIWVYIAWRHHPNYDAPAWWTWLGGSLITLGLISRYAPLFMQSRIPSDKV